MCLINSITGTDIKNTLKALFIVISWTTLSISLFCPHMTQALVLLLPSDVMWMKVLQPGSRLPTSLALLPNNSQGACQTEKVQYSALHLEMEVANPLALLQIHMRVRADPAVGNPLVIYLCKFSVVSHLFTYNSLPLSETALQNSTFLQ